MYRLLGDPPRGSEFVRTYEDLTVEEAPAEQFIILRQQKGCVLILKAIDAATGKGIPKVRFSRLSERDVQQGSTNVPSMNSPATNENGELRAIVQPGEGRYDLALPDGYERDNPDEGRGREITLPAGKTVTETFKLRKKK